MYIIIVVITDNSTMYATALYYYAYGDADDADPGGHTVFKLLQVNTINSDY